MPRLSDILEVYARYAPRISGLSKGMRRTDELIDALVYRLYGLTSEEVEVVEGEGSVARKE